jgi:hypothetical protein
MIWRCGSIPWPPSSRTLLACAGIFLSVSAVCQSDPAALMSDCLATNQQGLPAELRQTRTFGGKRDQGNPGIGATGTVLQDIQGTSYPELAHLDLRVRSFRSQSDYFRTRFSLSRFLLPLRMRYFVDVNPALFQKQAPPMAFVRFWLMS